MMDIGELIARLKIHLQSYAAYNNPDLARTLEDAAGTIAELQEENAYMRDLLRLYCGCKVCANAADAYGLHCKFGGCSGGGNGVIKEDRWELRKARG